MIRIRPWTFYNYLLAPINRRFGTYRGLARLLLARLELRLGRLRAYTRPNFERVQRVVFVCQGNICRSCFAEQCGRTRGLVSASFGFATAGNAPADPDAIKTAKQWGIDLTAHRTNDLEDFAFQDGDLLLVMEIRQARRLTKMLAGRHLQISLLGLWASPPRPHLHDPHGLDLDYFETCFEAIASAVAGIAERLASPGVPSVRGDRAARPS